MARANGSARWFLRQMDDAVSHAKGSYLNLEALHDVAKQCEEEEGYR